MSIFLSILALILFVVVYIIWLFVMLFTGVKKRKWYQLIDNRAYVLAFNVDVFGNYLFKDFWNATLSKKGYQFGIFGETISSVLGKKQIEKTLSRAGWVLLVIINVIDFTKLRKGGHCKYYIQSESEIRRVRRRINGN